MTISRPAVVGCIIWLFTAAGAISVAPAAIISDARLESVSKVWDAAPHNAFTGLTYYNGSFFLTFREGPMHGVPAAGQAGGKVRILTSLDGSSWSSSAVISLGAIDHDLRDPKLTVTPDGRLMLLATDVPNVGASGTRQSFTWFSPDGTNWSNPSAALSDSQWLWRATWNPANNAAYGVSYGSASGQTRLLASPTGTVFGSVVPAFAAGNETTLLFDDNGSGVALVRREGAGALVGVSSDMTNWTFQNTNVFVGGPDMIRIPDGRIIVGGRFLDNFSTNARTSLGVLNPATGSLQELLRLPSGGDTGYPGFVWKDNKLWVSYYSSHQQKASIYMATVTLGNLADSFTRADGSTATNSLGLPETGGYSYVERGNTAAQLIPTGTIQIAGNELRITGSRVGSTPADTTGGVYLSGVDASDVNLSMRVGFNVVGAAPSGIAGDESNKFNHNLLLMLRSRSQQNFGSPSSLENGMVAVEFGPNGDLLVREQTGLGASGLSTIANFNYFTGQANAREPVPGALPAAFGSGDFDVNQNGYIDSNERIDFGVELIGRHLQAYVNGLPYGPSLSLANLRAMPGEANGIGLHKNRLGSSFQVFTDVLVDDLDLNATFTRPGDFNGDDRVDGEDFLVWQRTAGPDAGPFAPADANNDGQIDQADLKVWQLNFGLEGVSESPTFRIPEPDAAILAITLFNAVMRRKRLDGLTRD
ncbi:dockerin type I domain-containing protein [Lacipirellula parvula]|uniref:EF-hand domain-containing protein n=1 Tax=Lacipirellula parvula TaxID=2650471 RepID=A0A5K7X8F1_9BACT|nr:dockerin type I domain-containing protein [Lacipirellula parvula]BBO32828.1 hypothetical protein PLANPX_2440 [Lacipirellula parvula]